MAVYEVRANFIIHFVFLSFTFANTFALPGKCLYEVADKKFEISDWTWSVPAGDSYFEISFCQDLQQCSNASICKVDAKSKTRLNFGKKPADTKSSAALANDHSGFSVVFENGDTCSQKTPSSKYKTEVYFSCGKTLGTPEFIEQNGCTTIFEFTTVEACKSPKKIKEIPCSILDRNKKLRDLTALVKTKGSHKVASAKINDFYINVCREISGEVSPGKPCPPGASSCINGADKGQIVQFSSLQLVNDYTVNLKYANVKNGCSTNITFICPKAISQHGGRGPVLDSMFGCHYEILWETEHACPLADQVSTSCNITTNDGFFDLSPLKRLPDHYYRVQYHNSKENKDYTFFMNICENMKNFPCNNAKNKTNVAVCQTFGPNEGRLAGDADHKKLRYVDNELILTYKHGDVCSSGFRRTSIISFYCNDSAGNGEPKFNHEDHCNYFFDWPTSIVCPRARKTGEVCRVITKDNVIYDLTELIKTGRDNWHAVDGTSSKISGIYINVCSQLRENAITKGCPEGNAACIVNGKSYMGLGKFQSNLTSDSRNSLKLTYEGGTFCDIGSNKRKRTVINFICHPGQLSTVPTLISKSEDDCDYEFVWQTAAACPLGTKNGSDCQVFDHTAGYSFDLRPISKARPVEGKDYFSYLDSYKEYEYQIKICEGSTQTKCSVNGSSVGACQYKEASKMYKSMGKANSNLVYFDGLLKLTYFHGEKCRNGQYRETHITFLCDQNAGIGNPQFEKEVSCGTYNFLWYTKYACQAKVVECTAMDSKTKKQYDLSKLANMHGWQATQGNKKFYLNVCRPLYERPNGCSSFSSACNVEVKTTSQGTSVEEFKNNLGSLSNPPTVQANGDLVIVYNGGDSCGKTSTITTKIRFICKSDGGEGSPEFDASASDSCNYIFKWETSYACPIGGATSGTEGTCTVQDPVSKYTFNLTPLTRSGTYYRVTNSGKVFILNICGNVTGSECNKLDPGQQVGGCIFTGTKGKNSVIGQVSKQLKYSVGQITLKYSGGERQSSGYDLQTTIAFVCNKNVLLGSPVFDKEVKNEYFFRFETSLACSPEPVQCRLAGPGNAMYNLEPLIRTKGYWTALNRETNGQKHHYFINVCQALDDRPAACPKGAIGACQIDYNAGRQTGHSIGYIVSNPRVKSKTLSIKYSNGEYCHHSKVNRSAQIFFHCSQNEGSPVFQAETIMCGYIFNWLTPSACPRVTSEGSNCRVEDSVFKHIFDFNSLKTTSVSAGSNRLIVNPCGAATGCDSKAGACRIDAGSSKTNIGNFENKIHLSNGDTFVEFTNSDIKTRVKFVCDRSTSSLSLVTDISKITPKLYEFEWKTSLACLPPYNVECSLFVNSKNEDEMYDLSPLSRWDDNWRAHVDQDTAASYVERQFYINVCRSILKKSPTIGCADEAGICMVREDGKKFNLGRILKSPYKENGEIILDYGQGDVCQGTERYSAKIRFTADAGEPDIGEPVLIRKQGCSYLFAWISSVARPVNKQKASPRTDCKIINPVTGHVIDLASLKATDDVKVVDGRGGYFMLSVCRSLKSQSLKAKCGQNSAVCRLLDSDSSYHMNSGSFSQTLAFDKVVSVKYTAGDNCPRCKCKRETIITFVCAPEEDVGKPVFMSQIEDCTYVFVWRTKHVCEKEIQCTAFGKKNTFYIGQLLKRNEDYLVQTAGNTKYYINICKDLIYSSTNPCPVGVAACKVEQIGGKDVATNLGEVTSSPQVNDDDSITLTYINGDQCPTDKTEKIRTIITFICQHGSRGEPVLKSSSDCVYHFEWKTFTVCKEDEKVDEAKCTVDDSRTKNKFDLSPLKKTHFNDYKVNSRYKSLTYFINVCGVTSVTHKNCSGAGICRMEKKNGKTVYTNLGLIKYQKLNYDSSQAALVIEYQQDDQGSKGPISQITFTCDELIDKGQPFLVNDMQTISKKYFFHWKTSLACSTPVISTSVVFNTEVINLKTFMINGKSLSAEDKRYTYKLDIIGGIKDGPVGCPKTAAVCRKSKSGDEVYVLAPVSSQKVTANSTNIIIDYSGGKSSCSDSKVRVVIVCGEDKRLIFIKSNDNDCSYLFHVQSKIVCKKKESGNSNSNEVNKQHAKPKKNHTGLIIFIIIAVSLALVVFGYIIKSPERRANTASCLRFKCKKYVCCKSMDVPGYKYKEVQAHVGSDNEDDDVEGLLLSDENETKLDEFEYKDEESEDDELLKI